jgi:predicted transcriptional regulator
MKYKSQTETQVGILEVCKKGINKTKLKQQAGLTSRQVRTYIPKVIKKGYVDYDKNTRLYHTTEKGLKLILFVGSMFSRQNDRTLLGANVANRTDCTPCKTCSTKAEQHWNYCYNCGTKLR